METKGKSKKVLVEKPKSQTQRNGDMRFTDKERKRQESKNHTIGGF